MKQRPRIHYTEGQKALMWERWQKGESLLRNTRRTIPPNCCIDRLNPQSLAVLRCSTSARACLAPSNR
jgi:hypothetical protein